MEGWGKVKAAAEYAGLSERTLRDLLKQGLKHSRLPSGTILIHYKYIDEFFESYTYDEDQVDKIVEQVLKDF